jgi:hypothetical protein
VQWCEAVCLGNLVAQVLADGDHQVGVDLGTPLAATSRAHDASVVVNTW